MQTYFLDNKSKNLILIFNGWGMDEKPFLIHNFSCDVLFVSDYSTLDENFFNKFDFTKYEKISLLAFSAGVLMSAYFKDKLPKIDYKIAVNGTCRLFEEGFGINNDTLAEMKSITLENALDFRRKLFSNDSYLDLFNKNQPSRDLQSSMKELSVLEEYSKSLPSMDFDKIIISKDDKIIPVQNQLNFWQGHKNVIFVEGGHFPFYNFESLENFL